MTFHNKQRFFKYLTIGNEDKRWGIYLTGAGHIQVKKYTKYPLIDDPSHHYFHWSVGRRLTEYQFIYITKGQGIFESEITGPKRINSGDIFILFPNVWHRFKPNFKTGWDEYWIEFDGELIKHFRKEGFLNPESPVLSIGIEAEIVMHYMKIIKLIEDEKPGFQYTASGILIQLFGQIFALKKFSSFEGRMIEESLKKAKLIMTESITSPVSQEEIARKIGISYSLYRKKFKEYTGISPAQYQIRLGIEKTKDLLITTQKPLKEIALDIGLESCDYLCRIFKQKTGYTPSEFRKKNMR
jgi:AraC-like DNA-binding protein